jgi:thiamine-monophosphate kinase
VSELERIARLRRIFGGARPPLTLGIGDDAAALTVSGTLVASVDAMVEGVHFERAWLSFGDLGWRATQAALSDLAAMGASATAVLSALVLPANVSDADLAALAQGQAEACASVGAQMAGGNLARGGELSITTTVLGMAASPMRRAGAKPGDGLWLAGDVGRAAAGLAALRAGRDDGAIAAWRRPRARIEEGLRAASVAHAAIDLSDGLARDASHLAEASGVKVMLDRAALPDGEDALYGGEDYALLVAAPAPIEGFRRIGRCQAGQGVWLDDEPIEPRGWDHFG